MSRRSVLAATAILAVALTACSSEPVEPHAPPLTANEIQAQITELFDATAAIV